MGHTLERLSAAGDWDDYFMMGALAAEAHANDQDGSTVFPVTPDRDAAFDYRTMQRLSMAPLMGYLTVRNPDFTIHSN